MIISACRNSPCSSIILYAISYQQLLYINIVVVETFLNINVLFDDESAIKALSNSTSWFSES